MSTTWHLYYPEGTQPYPQSFVPANYLPSYSSSWQHPGFPSSPSPSAGAADLAQPVNHDYPATSHYPDPSQQLPPHIEASPPSSHLYSNNTHRSPSSLPADYETAESFQAQVQDQQYAQVHNSATEPSHIHPTGSTQGSSGDTSAPSIPYPPPPLPLNPSPSHPAVKVEPNDAEGCFIIENPPTPCTGHLPSAVDLASAPPATVPLRASQASNDMRKMMTIFRVNPFSIQGGSKGGQPANVFGEACPLEEEPLLFEFQVNLDDEALPEHPSPPNSGEDERPTNPDPKRELSELRAFSPQFELEGARTPPPTCPVTVDACGASGKEPEPTGDWEDTDYSGQSDIATSSSVSTSQSVHTPGAGRFVYTPVEDPTPYGVRKSQSPMQICPPQQYLPSWDVAEPERCCPPPSDADDDTFSPPPSRVAETKAQQPMEVAYPVPLRAQRLHTATSHPYLRKTVLQAQVAASTSSMSSPSPHMSCSPRQSPVYAPYPHPQVASSVVHHHHHHHHAPTEAQQLQPSTKHSQAHTPPYPTPLPSSIHPQDASSDYQMDSSPHHSAHMGAYRYHPECESGVTEGNAEKYEVASGHTFYHAQPHQFYAAQPIPPRRWSLPETNVSQGHITAGPFIPSS